MSTFTWRGITRPDRPLSPREAMGKPVKDDPNAIACRERYEALRAAGLCIRCKGNAREASECLACRLARQERRAG